MYSLTKVTFTVFHCLLSFDSEYGGSSNGKKKKKLEQEHIVLHNLNFQQH